MAKKLKQTKGEKREALHVQFLKQMLALSTSAFGLVAALAWNQLIQDVVTTYIKPHVGVGSGTISLLIYAIIVTLLAVFITYNLTRLIKKD